MKRKKIIIISIIAVFILIIVFFIGKTIYNKASIRNIDSFLDNQDRIVKIEIGFGDGHYGEFTDKENISEILDAFGKIQVKKSKEIKNTTGYVFNMYCYDENNEKIFVLANRHPWYIKGNLAEGFYDVVTKDEFKQIYEQKLYPYTKPSD